MTMQADHFFTRMFSTWRIGRLALAILAMFVVAFAPRAQAQSLPYGAQSGCYNIVPAQAGAQPAILLDRCSGRTWQLLSRYRGGASAHRRTHLVYVWSPIDRSEREVARAEPPARAPAAAPAPAARGNSKCFVFNGRTFCE
jgi:hypothetical protein